MALQHVDLSRFRAWAKCSIRYLTKSFNLFTWGLVFGGLPAAGLFMLLLRDLGIVAAGYLLRRAVCHCC